MSVPTPHIEAMPGQIAKTVLITRLITPIASVFRIVPMKMSLENRSAKFSRPTNLEPSMPSFG